MLVDDEIKTLLSPIPLPGFQNRSALAATTNYFYPFKNFLAYRAGKIIRKPKHLMPASHQRLQISQGHPLRPAGQRILRVAPVEHQETHLAAA